MADELPRWSDIASRPDFLAADTATKEATRLNYRNELARMSFLAGAMRKLSLITCRSLTRSANRPFKGPRMTRRQRRRLSLCRLRQLALVSSR